MNKVRFLQRKNVTDVYKDFIRIHIHEIGYKAEGLLPKLVKDSTDSSIEKVATSIVEKKIRTNS